MPKVTPAAHDIAATPGAEPDKRNAGTKDRAPGVPRGTPSTDAVLGGLKNRPSQTASSDGAGRAGVTGDDAPRRENRARRRPAPQIPSFPKVAASLLAVSAAAAATRPEDHGAALVVPELALAEHNFSSILPRATNSHLIGRKERTHEPSPLESKAFQEKYAAPVGGAAIAASVAGLGLTIAMTRKGKPSSGTTAATLEEAESTQLPPAARRSGVSTSAPVAATAPASSRAGDSARSGAPQAATTLPLHRRFSSMLANAAIETLKTADLYAGLHPGDDAAFRETMMHPPEGYMSLPYCKLQLMSWAEDIARMPDLPNALKNHFRESIQDTIATIDGLATKANPWSRTAKLIAQMILNTPLPIVLPLFAVPMERQQMDVIIASYVKTTMLRGGLMMRGTAHNPAIANLYLNRDYANVIQSLALSLNLFDKTRGVANHPAYNIGAAVASAVALAYTFYPEQVKSVPSHIARAARQVVSFVSGNGRLPPREHSVRVGGVAVGDVSGGDKADLHALSTQVFETRDMLAMQKQEFIDGGKSVSDTADWQFGQILKRYYGLARDLEVFTAASAGTNQQVHDPDRAAKLALAIMSGAICIGVTVEFRQNKITAVDMGVDALFNIYNGLNQAFDPNVSWQQSLDTFKNWTSLSLVMAPMQAGNLAKGNLVEESDRNMLEGAGALTAANLLVAGPFGSGIKLVVGKALELAKREHGVEPAPALEMTPRGRPAESALRIEPAPARIEPALVAPNPTPGRADTAPAAVAMARSPAGDGPGA